MAKDLMKIRQNVNKCSSCKKDTLPEPIVFAKLSRRTNQPVCTRCYQRDNQLLSNHYKRIMGQ